MGGPKDDHPEVHPEVINLEELRVGERQDDDTKGLGQRDTTEHLVEAEEENKALEVKKMKRKYCRYLFVMKLINYKINKKYSVLDEAFLLLFGSLSEAHFLFFY